MRTSTSRPGERRRDVHSFERRARRYERGWRSAFHARVVTAAAEVALRAVPHPAAVLDVGCGTGALLRALAERLPAGVELCGVDPAPSMLQVGRAALGAHPRVRLVRAAAERLPFHDAGFDLVTSTVSFAHWADQPAGLAEVARVLRPGGRLVLVDLFAIGWLRPVAALGRRRDRMHTAAELRGMLADARLTLVGWRPVFGLGRLPLVSAAVAHSGRQAGEGPRTAQGRRSPVAPAPCEFPAGGNAPPRPGLQS